MLRKRDACATLQQQRIFAATTRLYARAVRAVSAAETTRYMHRAGALNKRIAATPLRARYTYVLRDNAAT